MNYGFITGLPRSGSAWLANYLSYGDVMMVHDAWKHGTPTEWKQRFAISDKKATGVSDPSSLFFLKDIDKEFPDAKWVVITKPYEEVEASCKNIDFPMANFTKQLQGLLDSRKVKKVPFNQIFDKADEIGRYIYEDWECPKWRHDQLKDLNVQVHWGRVSDQFRVPAALHQMDNLTPNKVAYFRLVKEIVNDDPYAVRFLAQAREVSELYRRLDQGKPIDVKKAKELLESMSTEWMISPFLKQFSASIAPAAMACFEKYQNDKNLSYCPIDVDLLTAVTYIFKGNDGVKEFMPKIRELSEKIVEEAH